MENFYIKIALSVSNRFTSSTGSKTSDFKIFHYSLPVSVLNMAHRNLFYVLKKPMVHLYSIARSRGGQTFTIADMELY